MRQPRRLARENHGHGSRRWNSFGADPAIDGFMIQRRTSLPKFLLLAFALIALYFLFKKREQLAAIALALAMIPTGLSMIEGVARMAPYFSLADLARFLNSRLDENGAVLFEGPLDDSSSLIFYLNQKFFLVNQNRRKEAPIGTVSTDIFLDEGAVLQKWSQPEAVYLIVEQVRVSHWKNLLIEHFHIYHQVTTSGTYVVLSNQL